MRSVGRSTRSTKRSVQTSQAILASFAIPAALALAGCGSQYRPVVSSINPVGPAAQPNKLAIAISTNVPPVQTTPATVAGPGLVTFVDFSGDTILDTTAIGINPYYLAVDANGGEAYTLNSDGTLNSFPISTGLIASNVAQSTVPPGAAPVSIYSQGTELYIAQPGRASVGQYTSGTAPAIKVELPTGTGSIYTVGSTNGMRAYALATGVPAGTTPTAPGTAAAIETGTNSISAILPVGINPVYGVMSVDSSLSTLPARRAFVLNHGSNTVTVINAQTNALDTFTVNGAVTNTIPVGVAPVWADLAPTLNELVVANQGNGSTPGTLSIINIPLCSEASLASNPNCDTANPVDAAGFGSVLANVTVGVNPIMVAVLGDGSRAYVANAGNPALGIAGSVSVVNLTTNTVTATIPAATSSNPNDLVVHGHPIYLAVTTGIPTGKVYIVSRDSTDISIIRTDTDTIQTHLALQGYGVSVRVNRP